MLMERNQRFVCLISFLNMYEAPQRTLEIIPNFVILEAYNFYEASLVRD